MGNYSAKSNSKEFLNSNCKEIGWVVDSGATHHCAQDRSAFTSYTPTGCTRRFAKVANGELVELLGWGDVCIRTGRGFNMMLKDVWHAPRLQKNLISVPALDEQGYSNLFVGGKYTLARGSLILAEAQKVNNKYILKVFITEQKHKFLLDHHKEKHFTAGEVVRDIIIGVSDGLTVPSAYGNKPFRSAIQTAFIGAAASAAAFGLAKLIQP